MNCPILTDLLVQKMYKQQDEWYFEVGVGKIIDLPIYVIVEFQRRFRLGNKELINDSCFRPPVNLAQKLLEMKSILLLVQHKIRKVIVFFQGHGQIVSWFKHVTKDDIWYGQILSQSFV